MDLYNWHLISAQTYRYLTVASYLEHNTKEQSAFIKMMYYRIIVLVA